MGFISDISNQIGQTANAPGQNAMPGNVVGNQGAPTASGKGGAASPFPGNTIGVNPPGGSGAGYNTGAPYMGNNSQSDIPDFSGLFGKGGTSAGPNSQTQPPTMMPSDNAAGAQPVTAFNGANTSGWQDVSRTQNPLISKGVMPVLGQGLDPMQMYNRPIGMMPPGQTVRPTPAPLPITQPRMAPPPRRGIMPVKGLQPPRRIY